MATTIHNGMNAGINDRDSVWHHPIAIVQIPKGTPIVAPHAMANTILFMLGRRLSDNRSSATTLPHTAPNTGLATDAIPKSAVRKNLRNEPPVSNDVDMSHFIL
jgi:hypothetical protein